MPGKESAKRAEAGKARTAAVKRRVATPWPVGGAVVAFIGGLCATYADDPDHFPDPLVGTIAAVLGWSLGWLSARMSLIRERDRRERGTG